MQFSRSLAALSMLAVASPLAMATPAIAASSTPSPSAALADWQTAWSYLPLANAAPLLAGKVVASSAPSNGATVVLFAEPTSMKYAVPGIPISLMPIARAMTASDGSWSIGVPDGTDLTQAAQPNGVINFEVRSFDGVGSDAYFFSATGSPASSARARASHVLSRVSVGGKSRVMTTDGAVPTVTLNSNTMPDQPVDAGSSSQSAARPRGIHNPAGRCVDMNITNYPTTKTVVGETYSNTAGVTASFKYSQSASSTLGVGVSGTGVLGTFKASGTTGQSASSTVTFPSLSGSGNRLYETYFYYKKFKETCAATTTSTSEWYDQATSWSGGAATEAPVSAINATNCVSQAAGSTFTKEATDARTESAGVSTLKDIGINLSSKTGFSTTSSVKYAFSAKHQLCGLNGYPANSPGALQAKA